MNIRWIAILCGKIEQTAEFSPAPIESVSANGIAFRILNGCAQDE
ncbi:MAG: hypothetical protein NT121_06470 [Chloroflexi bacterium]|nr:hypothetical protein [Chloroflexota bacterium]